MACAPQHICVIRYVAGYPSANISVKAYVLSSTHGHPAAGAFTASAVSRVGGPHAASPAEPDRGSGDLRLLLRRNPADEPAKNLPASGLPAQGGNRQREARGQVDALPASRAQG